MHAKIELIKKSTHHNFLYHFTDAQNLELIRSHGLLSLEQLSVKGISVPAPGGNKLSNSLDVQLKLNSYVHICFTMNHPMAHVAQKDGRISKIVWIRINPEVLLLPNVMFAPDIAIKTGVTVSPISNSIDDIDWDVIYTRMDWKNPSIKSRLDAAERYEILVPDSIGLKDIRIPNG